MHAQSQGTASLDRQDAEALVDRALAEDLSTRGDLTSRYFVPEDQRAHATIVAREACVVAGLEMAAATFQRLDRNLELGFPVADGDAVKPGDPVLHVAGATRSLLSAERTALNFLQRLSGIATLTRTYRERLGGSPTRLLDTRKTTPGWRQLEKAAVAAGGGHNHRFGLYDAIMVKDNHLLANADPDHLQRSISSARADHPGIQIELEVDTLDQLEAYLELDGVDRILVDNMDPPTLQEAVRLRDARRPEVTLEASGGITLESISEVAATGVDFISVGALTHSAPAVDLSLELEVDGTRG